MRDAESERRLLRARYFEKGDELLVVKIPEFEFSASEVDNIIGWIKAHKGVVLDLRGNPGGYLDTLTRLLGGLFEYDLKIYDRVRRDSTKPVSVTGRHHDAFTGHLVVLIDSESASSSELLARVVQLEKRGFIVGDRSSGKVMEATRYPHEVSLDTRIYYAVSVTEADLIMGDGKSLEHAGVEPDIVALPTGGPTSKRDPAMAEGARLVGGRLSAEEARAILPYEESSQFQTALSISE